MMVTLFEHLLCARPQNASSILQMRMWRHREGDDLSHLLPMYLHLAGLFPSLFLS